ncbi:MAG: phosphate acyltransferase PlsX [Bacillota bacterium]
MRIVVDAMGGDNAPEAVVRGALAAARLLVDTEIVLVGQEDRIMAELPDGVPGNLSVVHAPEVIAADEPPAVAVRKKRQSSLSVCYTMVRQMEGDAVVSAGSTGALLAGGLLLLGRKKGIDRPALAVVMPTARQGTVLLDVGANTDVKPLNLYQFGVMGSLYAEKVLGRKNPSVGLLNVGQEDRKGTEVTRQALELLSSLPGFCGNVEGRDISGGEVDVIVTDGFTGNVVLKHTEGMAKALFGMIKEEITRSFRDKIAALMLRRAFGRVKARLDYSEYGGAILLGLDRVSVKCHGSSDAKAITNGIFVARKFVESDLVGELERYLERP